jgi:hypothetical protein
MSSLKIETDPDRYPPLDPGAPIPDDPGELQPDAPEPLRRARPFCVGPGPFASGPALLRRARPFCVGPGQRVRPRAISSSSAAVNEECPSILTTRWSGVVSTTS